MFKSLGCALAFAAMASALPTLQAGKFGLAFDFDDPELDFNFGLFTKHNGSSKDMFFGMGPLGNTAELITFFTETGNGSSLSLGLDYDRDESVLTPRGIYGIHADAQDPLVPVVGIKDTQDFVWAESSDSVTLFDNTDPNKSFHACTFTIIDSDGRPIKTLLLAYGTYVEGSRPEGTCLPGKLVKYT